MSDDKMISVAGVIHIHSIYSDGSKTIEEIAEIGEKAGLDFLMFTDHNTLKPLHDGKQRFYGKTAVIIGYEIEDENDENHYLAFGLKETLPRGLKAPEYVKGVKDGGGFGIVAHPDEIRREFPQYPSYPWTDRQASEFDGIEIWNHMSAWMESLKKINVLKMAISPRRSLRGPTDRVLKLWDDLSRERRVVGIGSADVHAHLWRSGPLRLTIFPYKVQFRSIRTHILLDENLSDDIETAKNQIFDALRSCRAFVSNYRWGDASSFRFHASCDNGIGQMGEDIPLESKPILKMKSPRQADIKLVHDGKTILTDFDDHFEFPVVLPGLYRVELFIKKRGWVYSNHIRILP